MTGQGETSRIVRTPGDAVAHGNCGLATDALSYRGKVSFSREAR